MDRLIARGNLVNVTSLFYLVPAVTAVMDYLIFGNRLAMLGKGRMSINSSRRLHAWRLSCVRYAFA